MRTLVASSAVAIGYRSLDTLSFFEYCGRIYWRIRFGRSSIERRGVQVGRVGRGRDSEVTERFGALLKQDLPVATTVGGSPEATAASAISIRDTRTMAPADEPSLRRLRRRAPNESEGGGQEGPHSLEHFSGGGDPVGNRPTEADPPPIGLTYLFEITKNEVETQFRISERIDSKARNLFALTAAIFAAAQAVALRPDVLRHLEDGKAGLLTYAIVAGVLVGLALLATAVTLFARNDKSVEPDPLMAWLNETDSGEKSEREIAQELISSYITLLRERRDRNIRRARDLVFVQFFSVLAIIASMVELIVALGGLT